MKKIYYIEITKYMNISVNKITIDSHQVFPELETNKIDVSICESDNPRTGLFLEENKHLINKDILNNNTNDWAVEYLINNSEYIDTYFFSENENNLAVNFIINNPQYIEKTIFAYNTNFLAIEYMKNM